VIEEPGELQPEQPGVSVPAPAARPRRHRRVRTEPVPGSDPTPMPEPPRHASDENDARLNADKPPHY
jgi:hypothetical protein